MWKNDGAGVACHAMWVMDPCLKEAVEKGILTVCHLVTLYRAGPVLCKRKAGRNIRLCCDMYCTLVLGEVPRLSLPG